MSLVHCGGVPDYHGHLGTNSKGSSGIEESRHLRSIVQASRETEIPNAVVRDGAELLLRRDGDRDSTILLGDVLLNREFTVEMDNIQVSDRVVVEIDGIICSCEFGQRLVAVLGVAVELDVDLSAGSDSRVVGDALEDVDTVVVAFAPGYNSS